jgi:two-component system, sensor histidine kinase and response regulator
MSRVSGFSLIFLHVAYPSSTGIITSSRIRSGRFFSVDSDVPLTLIGDSLRLGQVLTNLTNNALKFTEQGEIIVAISVTKEEKDNVELKFSIQDTGIGLSPEQISNLFQEFSQADSSTTRKYGGTGLGLTISKRLTEMMNGKIWVESVLGKGSNFIFTACFGVRPDKKRNELVLPKILQNMRILIVDDNESARIILKIILESFSLEVEIATFGEEGITKVEETDIACPFDLIFMDWQLPDMNGIRSAEIIKSNPKLRHIPKIIMLTAHGSHEIMRQAKESGLDGFLQKPIDSSSLFNSILEVFGEKSSLETDTRIYKISKNEQSIISIKGAKILLVEDIEINQEIAKKFLEKAGIVVAIANNGKEAVEMVSQSDYDCVLMDCQMPVMDGYEATQIIRKEERFSSLPIIAMTANAMRGDREKCINAGMDDHIPKPINPNGLLSTLAKWVSPRENSDEEIAASEISTVSKADKALSKLEGIDVNFGLSMVDGDVETYKMFLVRFFESNITAYEKIQKALDANNLKQAEFLVHTVRGGAGNIGAKILSKVGESLEIAISNNQIDSLQPLLGNFSKSLNQVLDSINELIPQQNQEQEKELDFSKTTLPQKLINDMREKVKIGRIFDMEQHIDELKKIKPFGPELAKHIQGLMKKYDSQGLLDVLELIEKNN